MQERHPFDSGSGPRILVVKLSSLGDVIHATPVLRAARAAWPHAHVALAVEARYTALVEHNPAVAELLPATSDPTYREQLAQAEVALAGRSFDLALDLQGNNRSAAWINASNASHKAGRAAPGSARVPREGWWRIVRPDLRRHAIQICADVAREAGIPAENLEPEIHLSTAADAALLAHLGRIGMPERGFLVANPFSRWPSKAWPIDRYRELVGRLLPSIEAPIVVTGGPEEREGGEALAGSIGDARVRSLAGHLPLDQSLCLYRRAELMVTGDSGPMHAAAALGTPVVALFGPTWPECTGPWGARHRVLQESRSPSPRSYRGDAECRHIRSIEVASVEREILALWHARLADARP